MKRLILLFASALLLSACSGVKKTQQALNRGDYNEAISNAVKQLQKNKERKGNQPYIVLLEEAYAKTTKKVNAEIEFLKKENNPANYERIYENYASLIDMQNSIQPLLPLYINDRGREAKFVFKNYDDMLLAAKDDLTVYLYNKAIADINRTGTKQYYRGVYRDLDYLDEINPGYKDVRTLMERAHNLGTNYIMVNMDNRTNVIIPRRLEADLLNFNTYGLDDFWTVYHSSRVANIEYDFDMSIEFRNINISPEQIKERVIEKEKQIKDGWEYLYDDNGDPVLDENGDKIKVDKFRTVRCTYYEFTQFKATQVVGNISFLDNASSQVTNNFPLSSEFVFEHVYANYDGDRRALDTDLVRLLGLQAVPFPSNEQMVFDTGEDLKENIKSIIKRHRF